MAPGDPVRSVGSEEQPRPTAVATAILGRKWHPAILYHLLEDGPLRYSELEARLPDVSAKVLSESLTDLDEKALVERRVSDGTPVRVEYELTAHGEALRTVITGLVDWGRTYRRASNTPEEFGG